MLLSDSQVNDRLNSHSSASAVLPSASSPSSCVPDRFLPGLGTASTESVGKASTMPRGFPRRRISASVGARSWMQTAFAASPAAFRPTAVTCHKLPGSRRRRCLASPRACPAGISNSRSRSLASSSTSCTSQNCPSTTRPISLSASRTRQALEASTRTTTSIPPGSPVRRTRTPEIKTVSEGVVSSIVPQGFFEGRGALINLSTASTCTARGFSSSSVTYW
mmetsp:Transcript_70288/g.139299  ORF Transcript_70288/g.139299 Transcript_70288/m.139299 type:complete len:221 (+) Transcript_70288:1056-1718(+)